MTFRCATYGTFAALLPQKFLVLLGSTSKPAHPVTVLLVRKTIPTGILALRDRWEFVHLPSSSVAIADCLAVLDSLVLHLVSTLLDQVLAHSLVTASSPFRNFLDGEATFKKGNDRVHDVTSRGNSRVRSWPTDQP